MKYTPPYKQKILSYKIVFFDMDDKEIEIGERVFKQAYSEIDQAIYEWEMETDDLRRRHMGRAVISNAYRYDGLPNLYKG